MAIDEGRKHVHMVKIKFYSLPPCLPSEGFIYHQVPTVLFCVLSPTEVGGTLWYTGHSDYRANSYKILSMLEYLVAD